MTETAKLTASDTADYDLFGNSVGISGDTIIVGAYYEDGAGVNRGAAYVFESPPLAPPAIVPTMTEWGMLILMVLLGIASVYYLRRRRLAV